MSSALQVIANSTGVTPDEVAEVLRGMIISGKGQHGAVATNAEMTVVSSIFAKYDLNPFIREGHAFISGGKLQVMIGFDGFVKIMNRQPDFDGVEFEDNFDSNGELISVTTKIHVKGRSFPTCVTEYMDECYQPTSPAWKKYKKRMLRNKSLGQCVRVAFGVADLLDEDEASRITGNQQPIKDITPQAPAVDLKALNDRMAQFVSLDDLDAECKAIANELRASGQFDSVRGDLSLMKREHVERINALDVIDGEVEFGEVIDGEQAE